MFGRQDEKVLTEYDIKEQLIKRIKDFEEPVLFQSSGQNIDRLVTFYRTALKLKKLFIIDVYTANILYELRNVGNNQLPYPSEKYNNIRVFFPL